MDYLKGLHQHGHSRCHNSSNPLHNPTIDLTTGINVRGVGIPHSLDHHIEGGHDQDLRDIPDANHLPRLEDAVLPMMITGTKILHGVAAEILNSRMVIEEIEAVEGMGEEAVPIAAEEIVAEAPPPETGEAAVTATVDLMPQTFPPDQSWLNTIQLCQRII